MVTHLSYSEERYRNAVECVAGIRAYFERGWSICQLRGPAAGPYIVFFRMEDTQP